MARQAHAAADAAIDTPLAGPEAPDGSLDAALKSGEAGLAPVLALGPFMNGSAGNDREDRQVSGSQAASPSAAGQALEGSIGLQPAREPEKVAEAGQGSVSESPRGRGDQCGTCPACLGPGDERGQLDSARDYAAREPASALDASTACPGGMAFAFSPAASASAPAAAGREPPAGGAAAPGAQGSGRCEGQASGCLGAQGPGFSGQVRDREGLVQRGDSSMLDTMERGWHGSCKGSARALGAPCTCRPGAHCVCASPLARYKCQVGGPGDMYRDAPLQYKRWPALTWWVESACAAGGVLLLPLLSLTPCSTSAVRADAVTSCQG